MSDWKLMRRLFDEAIALQRRALGDRHPGPHAGGIVPQDGHPANLRPVVDLLHGGTRDGEIQALPDPMKRQRLAPHSSAPPRGGVILRVPLRLR